MSHNILFFCYIDDDNLPKLFYIPKDKVTQDTLNFFDYIHDKVFYEEDFPEGRPETLAKEGVSNKEVYQAQLNYIQSTSMWQEYIINAAESPIVDNAKIYFTTII